MVFPADVSDPIHFVDISKPPYSAENTGKQDVTPFIRQAIVDLWNNNRPQLRQRTLYFPNGADRFTDRIDSVAPDPNGKMTAAHRLMFLGQSRDKTILRLDPDAVGFNNLAKPEAMIQTESIGGHGNDAYSASNTA